MNINEYLAIVHAEDASDLYLTTHARATIRINGTLQAIEEEPLAPGKVEELALSMMDDEQKAEFHRDMELNLAYATEESRFRVNVFRQKGEVGMVIRSIKLEMPDMDKMHLPAEVFKKVIMRKRGLILFVGATSSGKSTSLAAMINYRNMNDSSHIITIEDPMEYVHPHKKCIIEQREVGFDTHSYDEALKNTLRQAPDVILIGEIRTRETMEHAITFAETGHLCLSTLHANNANQAFARILSFFPQDRHERCLLELALNVRAIISQRLIPCIKGGLVPAVEVLLDSPLISELIKRGELREIKDVMRKSDHMGMQTFDQALYNLIKEGLITKEDALMNADSANDLRLMIESDENAMSDEDVEELPEEELNDNTVRASKLRVKKKTGFTLEKSDEEDEDDSSFMRR